MPLVGSGEGPGEASSLEHGDCDCAVLVSVDMPPCCLACWIVIPVGVFFGVPSSWLLLREFSWACCCCRFALLGLGCLLVGIRLLLLSSLMVERLGWWPKCDLWSVTSMIGLFFRFVAFSFSSLSEAKVLLVDGVFGGGLLLMSCSRWRRRCSVLLVISSHCQRQRRQGVVP